MKFKKNDNYWRSLKLGLRHSLWDFPTRTANAVRAPLMGLFGHIGSTILSFSLSVLISLYILLAGLFGYVSEKEENQPTS